MTGTMPRREAGLSTAGSASRGPSIDCGGVLSADPTRKPAGVSPAKTRKKSFILLVFVFGLAAFVGARIPLQGTDFPDFYCAARMLAGGLGHQLYDADLQRQYQARYAGRVGTLYIHPPFEAVLYLSVAWLPLRYAYLLWSLLNLAFLAVAARRLVQELAPPRVWFVWFASSLIFVPVLLCLLQGQDSLLLLLLIVLAFVALRRDRAFAAGCWLGLGLFKFHLVLPLVAVLVLTQDRNARSALAKGFSLVALALAGLSAGISGWSVFLVYPRFLLHLQAQPFAGIVPQAMANLRGLVSFFFHDDHSPGAVVTLSILCSAALIKTWMGWKKQGEFDLAFANTVVFALLVSYHLNPHDLSLLLLTITLLLHRALTPTQRVSEPANWVTFVLLAILFLPPLHLLALRTGVYALLCLPLLAIFSNVAFLVRQDKPRQGKAPVIS
jgi:Glycosyltransferase family 87